MINFPHPANASTTVTMTFKSDYKFLSNIGFTVINYSSWNKDYQVMLEYYVNASTGVLTSNAPTQFNYFMLVSPVIFMLL
jgi:hypothetical protein